ncbi:MULTISPECIES: class A sortase [unclassified Granulicatella]|uniref:class A sortase n=1 Tax=unclassified Granulicatella TaxID=2630493 RepID=UPI001074245D|nr:MULTISPECIES: class A sortase [unclassified Granulicatella]MBF0779609.1 class A sortase [Granulicatella sp. 19428wC4_WM01]TFU96408.1 class A sortase [Granulicatella sp. WM01]
MRKRGYHQQVDKKKQKRKKGYIFLNIIACLLVVVGVVLIFQQPIRDYLLSMKIASHEAVAKTVTAQEIEQNNAQEANFDFESLHALSLQSVLEANIDSSQVKSIGEIAIPSVEINLTIAKGVSDLNMTVGAGTLRPDQVMGQGNYTLASHYSSYGGGKLLFTPLHRISTGAKIYITDLKNVYVYDVYWYEIVPATHVDLVDDVKDDKIITLITCEDGNAINRLAVRGRLSATYSTENAPKEALEAFQIMKNGRQV